MSEKSSGNFFTNLFSSLFGSNDADAEKKRQLKAIAKKYSKCKFNRYYKYAGNEMLPDFGKLFYDLYKAIYPAQAMFHAIQNPNILKHMVVSYSTPEEIKKIEDTLNEQKILEMAAQIPLENLKKQIDERIEKFSDYYTLDKITEIDVLNKQLQAFQSFCTYDFFFVLKKFDKTIREGEFTGTPRFEKVNAEYMIDDIKDFAAVAWAIPADADWTNLFKLMKMFKGVEPISLSLWKRVVSKIQAIRASGALDYIVKLASSNPAAVIDVPMITSNIVEPYIEKIKNDTESTIQKLLEKERDSKTNDLVSQLFGDAELVSTKNYTTALNATFERKGIEIFNNAQALSYLKSFIIEVVKKDIHEYYDIVIVRGQWDSQSLCAPFNDGYNHLLLISDQITTFDNDLAENAAIGMKIKTLLPKTERDNGSKNIINRLVTEANETAYQLIAAGSKDLISIGKIIKSIVEDSAKQKPTMIANWKELEHYSDVPLREFSINIYKKIYLLTTLIKTCLVAPEQED